jgi:hypothetical protein
MNENIIEFALKAKLLNYVDNETPRRYFIDANAGLEEIEKFYEIVTAHERHEYTNRNIEAINLIKKCERENGFAEGFASARAECEKKCLEFAQEIKSMEPTYDI